MAYINNFGILAGDSRQIALARSLLDDGYNAYIYGFENTKLGEEGKSLTLDNVIGKSEVLILPVPVTRDNVTLNAPFSNYNVILDDKFAKKMEGKKVFCGMSSKLYQTSDVWNEIEVYDYYEREEYAIKNAIPTAEGAIEIAMQEYDGTINGSKCLVSGFGRIGKVLAKMLKGIGANVTVSARKQSDLAWIEASGYKAIKTCDIYMTNNYDLIFNTIPHMIFDSHTLARSATKAIIIDLASLPGGVDFSSARRLGIKAIQGLSLPGKVAPKAAGEIVKQTIYNMLEEDGG